MNEEEIYYQIDYLQGDILDLERELNTMHFYAYHIAKDRTGLDEQTKPLEDKIASLEAEIDELYKLL